MGPQLLNVLGSKAHFKFKDWAHGPRTGHFGPVKFMTGVGPISYKLGLIRLMRSKYGPLIPHIYWA